MLEMEKNWNSGGLYEVGMRVRKTTLLEKVEITAYIRDGKKNLVTKFSISNIILRRN
jgi:hypothetical protein